MLFRYTSQQTVLMTEHQKKKAIFLEVLRLLRAISAKRCFSSHSSNRVKSSWIASWFCVDIVMGFLKTKHNNLPWVEITRPNRPVALEQIGGESPMLYISESCSDFLINPYCGFLCITPSCVLTGNLKSHTVSSLWLIFPGLRLVSWFPMLYFLYRC